MPAPNFGDFIPVTELLVLRPRVTLEKHPQILLYGRPKYAPEEVLGRDSRYYKRVQDERGVWTNTFVYDKPVMRWVRGRSLIPTRELGSKKVFKKYHQLIKPRVFIALSGYFWFLKWLTGINILLTIGSLFWKSSAYRAFLADERSQAGIVCTKIEGDMGLCQYIPHGTQEELLSFFTQINVMGMLGLVALSIGMFVLLWRIYGRTKYHAALLEEARETPNQLGAPIAQEDGRWFVPGR